MVQPLREPGQLASTLRDAGFSEVSVIAEVDDRLHADATQWWERTQAMATTKAALDSLGPERRARFQEEAFERLQSLSGPGGIVQRIQANFGLARNS